MAKTFYMYDENSEYCGEQRGFLDPLETKKQGEDVYLVPPNSTEKKPTQKDGFVAVWNGAEWTQVEDRRGELYWVAGAKFGDAPEEMRTIGALPEGATLEPPKPTEAELAEQALAEAKAVRAAAVDAITVEVDGLTFDANEAAQSRMARSIAGAVALGLDLGKTKTQWVLADNTIAEVTGKQLALALQKAGEAQTALWLKPYED